ncbi:MAG: hypothetical protein ABWX92_17950, partial [Mycetocola sp.]
KLLSEHGDSGRVSSRKELVECLCGVWLHVGAFLDPTSGYADPDVEGRIRSEHIADAILTSDWYADHTFQLRRCNEARKQQLAELEALRARVAEMTS